MSQTTTDIRASAATPGHKPADAKADIAVSIRGITKRFGTTVALDAASLDIRKGEFFSLLGPSGCGKTTLLRIIGGFESPTDGDLLIGGRSVVDDMPYQRRTNMVFQHGALFPHLTVAENIAFGLEMKKVSVDTIRTKVKDALALVRLPGYGDRRIDQLSGGQRQRIAMARALVNDPEVLLLDEPLSALDLQLRLQMQDELQRLHRAIGGTFIFVTHDQGEAISLSDRIAVMSEGKILQIGTPRDVYEHPMTRFVAQFMGHSNFLEGTVEHIEADGVGRVKIKDGALVGRIPAALAVGRPVTVALRHEKVEVAPSGATPGRAATKATLLEETYMGATIRRRVDIPGVGELISDTANTGSQPQYQPGSDVVVHWSLDSPSILTE
jgi:spermidine/putrescine transport system ATP-binding protein